MEKDEKRTVYATIARLCESYWPILVLFGAFLAYLLATRRFGIGVFDEGLALLGAQNVLAGEIPNRDFWAPYPPGGFYWVAALFRIFGSSILVAHIQGALITFFGVVCVFWIARRITSLKYAVASAILVIWAFIGSGSGVSISLLLGLVASVYLFRLRTYDRTRDLLVLGLVTALCMLFRVDDGLYLFVALSAVLILCNYSAAEVTTRKERVRKSAKMWGVFVSGILVIGVPVLVLVLHAVPLQDLVDQFIVYPRSIYPAFRSLPRPSLFYGSRQLRALFYFPILVYSATALWLGVRVVQHKTKLSQQSKPLFLLIFGALLFIYGSVRIDSGHLAPTFFISAILFFWLVYSLTEAIRRCLERRASQAPGTTGERMCLAGLVIAVLLLFVFLYATLGAIYGNFRIGFGLQNVPSIVAVALSLWLLVSFIQEIRTSLKRSAAQTTGAVANLLYLLTIALVALLLLNSAFSAVSALNQPGVVPLDISRAQGIYESAGEARNLTDAITFIQTHVPENQTIFVGNTQHERILINNVIFYFLAGRASATKYYDLEPGIATTATVQNHIINDIVTHDTKYIVIWSSALESAKEPNQERYPSGVKNLDNFITANFVPVKQYGEYTIYARNDVFASSPEYHTPATNSS